LFFVTVSAIWIFFFLFIIMFESWGLVKVVLRRLIRVVVVVVVVVLVVWDAIHRHHNHL